jgi:hypothetical protein
MYIPPLITNATTTVEPSTIPTIKPIAFFFYSYGGVRSYGGFSPPSPPLSSLR